MKRVNFSFTPEYETTGAGDYDLTDYEANVLASATTFATLSTNYLADILYYPNQFRINVFEPLTKMMTFSSALVLNYSFTPDRAAYPYQIHNWFVNRRNVLYISRTPSNLKKQPEIITLNYPAIWPVPSTWQPIAFTSLFQIAFNLFNPKRFAQNDMFFFGSAPNNWFGNAIWSNEMNKAFSDGARDIIAQGMNAWVTYGNPQDLAAKAYTWLFFMYALDLVTSTQTLYGYFFEFSTALGQPVLRYNPSRPMIRNPETLRFILFQLDFQSLSHAYREKDQVLMGLFGLMAMINITTEFDSNLQLVSGGSLTEYKRAFDQSAQTNPESNPRSMELSNNEDIRRESGYVPLDTYSKTSFSMTTRKVITDPPLPNVPASNSDIKTVVVSGSLYMRAVRYPDWETLANPVPQDGSQSPTPMQREQFDSATDDGHRLVPLPRFNGGGRVGVRSSDGASSSRSNPTWARFKDRTYARIRNAHITRLGNVANDRALTYISLLPGYDPRYNVQAVRFFASYTTDELSDLYIAIRAGDRIFPDLSSANPSIHPPSAFVPSTAAAASSARSIDVASPPDDYGGYPGTSRTLVSPTPSNSSVNQSSGVLVIQRSTPTLNDPILQQLAKAYDNGTPMQLSPTVSPREVYQFMDAFHAADSIGYRLSSSDPSFNRIADIIATVFNDALLNNPSMRNSSFSVYTLLVSVIRLASDYRAPVTSLTEEMRFENFLRAAL